MQKYKIIGIYYSKPKLTRDANGEAMSFRYGICANIGQLFDFNGMGLKTVENIVYNKELDLFEITFVKGGVLTVPRQADTEVLYEEIKEK